MIVTGFVRLALKSRRFWRALGPGWERVEGPWDLTRGGRWGQRIVDVRIVPGGKDLAVKVERDAA